MTPLARAARTAALVSLTLASSALASPPVSASSWNEVSTKHFRFVSSASPRDTVDLARDLEALANALETVRPEADGSRKTVTVFVFTRRDDADRYLRGTFRAHLAEVDGGFVAYSGRAYMLIDQSRGPLRDRTPYHELVHYLLGTTARRPPLWLEEGLAEYYSSAEVRGGIVRVGRRIREHVQTLRRRRLLPAAELLAATALSGSPEARVFYAQSWALVDWMIHRDRAAFDAFFGDVLAGSTSAEALEKHFRRSPADLDRLLQSYDSAVMPREPVVVSVPLPDTPRSVLLEFGDVLFELGTYLEGIPDRKEESAALLLAAAEAHPGDARVWIALARRSIEAKSYLEAADHFDRALAAEPSNPVIYLEFAELLLAEEMGPSAQTGDLRTGDVPRFERARALATKALELQGDRSRALTAIGIAHIARPERVSEGVRALEAAAAASPERTDVALHLLYFVRLAGETERARTLQTRLSAVGDPHVTVAISSIIVRTNVSASTALTKQNRLKEAAALLSEAIPHARTDTVRAWLETEAARLSTTASVNAQIESYNAAVRLFNSGKFRESYDELQSLLPTITEDDLRSDAKALHELVTDRLRKRGKLPAEPRGGMP